MILEHCNRESCVQIIEALQARLDAYSWEAENTALRKDAERYRWLRDNPDFQIEYTGELTLDQHIDEAMGAK
jgi:hypothetical protein